jgi:6-pyruvoyltetrahydropterin/6-carboxytetrahydropterin synthase
VSGRGHFLISAETTFSAAHRLAGAGECEQLHGHNWQVRLTVRVEEEQLDEQGMGADFRVIEEIATAAVADFDHAYLNDLEPFKETPPTAESIARAVYRRASEHLREVVQAARLAEVEVWEMAGYRAVYRPE